MNIPTNGQLEVNLYDIPVKDFGLFLLKSNYDPLKEVVSKARASHQPFQTSRRTYYLRSCGILTPNSWNIRLGVVEVHAIQPVGGGGCRGGQWAVPVP
ncbi:MAG: hypothetical protein IPM82_05560 [Saprospiraceae bacterium]|nr:hypothetical protein [Saprospiraceae bacterium]